MLFSPIRHRGRLYPSTASGVVLTILIAHRLQPCVILNLTPIAQIFTDVFISQIADLCVNPCF